MYCFQCPSCAPHVCPSDALCPAGSVQPHNCKPPWYTKDKNSEHCKATGTLIGLSVGLTIGERISSSYFGFRAY